YGPGYPSAEQCEAWMQEANLEGEVVIDEFELLFKSSREFFFAPVIEFGPLTEWKTVAGEGQELQDVFWYIKEAIDAYFENRAFSVTVRAGCIIGKKSDRVLVTRPIERAEPKHLPVPPTAMADGTVSVADMDVAGVQELPSDDDERATVESVDVELDAFVDGRRRPKHLVD
ncbi:MAG: hypothetical protein KBG15_15275, partial [Kofleriaceae bacterium]|nr:hypothetical protein [Kofleriaceae bacterium]